MIARIGRNLLVAFLVAIVAFVGLNVFADGNVALAAGPVCAVPAYDPPALGGKGDVHIEWAAPEAKGDLFIVLVKFAKGMIEQEILDIAYRQELYISRSGGNVYGRSSVDTGRYAIVTHHKNVWGVDGMIEVHPNQQNVPLCWGNPTIAVEKVAVEPAPSPTPEPVVVVEKEPAVLIVGKEVAAPERPLANYLKDITVSVAQPITYTGTFTSTEVHTVTGRAAIEVPVSDGVEALMFFDIGIRVEPRRGYRDGITAIVETVGAVLVDQAIRITTDKNTVWPDIWYDVYGAKATSPTLEDAYNLSRNGALKLSNGSIEAVAGKTMTFNVPFSFEVAAAEAVTDTAAAATTGVIATTSATVTITIDEETNTLYEAWTVAYGKAPTKAEWQKYAAENDIPLSETTGNPIVRLGQALTFEVPATAAP